MKKLNIMMFLIIIILLLSGCSRRITKRKGCRGNGHWYGKRNLSYIKKDTPKYAIVVF